jgi:MFS family permease
MPRRGLSLAVLIVNQLLAGVGVATGMALAAILTADLTGAVWMGGLAQSSSVLGAAIVAVPLARLAIRSGRHVALATGYALACVGAILVIVAASSGMAVLVFLGLAAFGAGAAAGLQARFAATEVAAPGFEARSMSLVLWATTIGSVAGPLLSQTGDTVGQSLGLPPLVGPFVFSAVAFAASSLLVGTLLRTPKAGYLANDVESAPDAAGVPVPVAASDSAGASESPRRLRPSRPSPPRRRRPRMRGASARGRRCASPCATRARSSRSSRSCARRPS